MRKVDFMMIFDRKGCYVAILYKKTFEDFITVSENNNAQRLIRVRFFFINLDTDIYSLDNILNIIQSLSLLCNY